MIRIPALRAARAVARAATLRPGAVRTFCAGDDPLQAPREKMEYDVVIVGGGPAGLGAAIRLKQLTQERGTDLSVCVVEKGSEVGSHILSGNVFEPRALNELIPDWKEKGAPVATPVKEDRFLFLTEKKSYTLPNALLPPVLHNDGNYVISLSQLTRWLAGQAEELGVEIYPGFAASEVVYTESGGVRGIATRDVGIGKDGKPKDTFERGMELHARQTLFAEGCRGSCSEELMKKFDLRRGAQVQTYGLGVKEVWEVPEDKCRPGFVQHTLGWPLQHGAMDKTFGGSFLYHMEPNLVLVGFVVGLDYHNPYLSPYEELQRFKHHPAVASHLEGGKCIAYGARCLNEGGYHAIPRLTFPGGALIGCSAGFLNSVKIKGTHTALKSGMVAAESMYDRLASDAGRTVASAGGIDAAEQPEEAQEYQDAMENSWVYKELRAVRNCHQAFKFGFLPGLAYSGLATHVLKGREPWTIDNKVPDSAKTEKASKHKPIQYPKPDGKLSFDLLTNLARSGTNHNHDQPAHLRVKPELADVPASVSYPEFAGPEQRFCPAKVYEYAEGEDGKPKLVINAQNCVHCKCCSIKTPKEFINWTVPEGGGGPAYTVM